MLRMDQKRYDEKNGKSLSEVNQMGAENLRNSGNGVVVKSETEMKADGNLGTRVLGAKINEMGSTQESVELTERVSNTEIQDRRMIAESSCNSVNGVVLKSEDEMNSDGDLGIRVLGSKIDDMGSTQESVESTQRAVNNEIQERRMVAENLNDPVNGVAPETEIMMNSEQKGGFESKHGSEMELSCRQGDGSSAGTLNSDQTAHVSGKSRKSKESNLAMSKELVENFKKKVGKTEDESCVIDVKCGDGTEFKKISDGEMVCRICHLSSEQPLQNADDDSKRDPTTTNGNELIQLGCGCKDDLGIAHSHCAEAWFKLKGNR